MSLLRKRILDYIVAQVNELKETNERDMYTLVQVQFGLKRNTFQIMLRELHYTNRIKYNYELGHILSLKS